VVSAYSGGVEERYPIGATSSTAVTVLRHEGTSTDYAQWTVAMAVREGDATLRLPGHYAAVLAARLRGADGRFGRGGRLGRDEYLDLTAIARDGTETLALSSTARSPVRVTVEVPRDELEQLAELLDAAAEIVETLRQGISAVPDRLPETH
jgi:hypothetical protein